MAFDFDGRGVGRERERGVLVSLLRCYWIAIRTSSGKAFFCLWIVSGIQVEARIYAPFPDHDPPKEALTRPLADAAMSYQHSILAFETKKPNLRSSLKHRSLSSPPWTSRKRNQQEIKDSIRAPVSRKNEPVMTYHIFCRI